jgi:malate dehydrogenase (oxaloacetate-decarboxylating)(NADP+)
MYFSPEDKGSIREILDNWPQTVVDIIVVTDGSRILGLGDLGVNGMGIPVGKLSLYVAGAGFHPSGTLPVTFDFGTNNEKYLNDPEYLGRKEKRISGEEYLALIDEFMVAVTNKWPKILVQFEDFSNDHAFLLLERYRNKYLCFNDDIQGTGAVVLSGFINSLRIAKINPKDVRLVFSGAGSAGIGVADMIVSFISKQTGQTPEESRRQFWFQDSQGLITKNRGDKLAEHKIPFAREDNGDTQIETLKGIVEHVKPHALIGLSGIGGTFTEDVSRAHISEPL